MESNGKEVFTECVLDIIMEKLIETRVFTKVESDCEADKELVRLSEIIRNRMGSDHNLFLRYEELSTICENDSLKDAYKKGLKDGIRLLRDILLEGKTFSRFP